ncbi:PadR family transcriptional regulator [Propionimicrobium sp. PCR01-08-3]|uniref:PadR family transcriptional regulator n=1 Tax=Propionimicrobium sp. PCR01-08-3 TaxID=3052086 RepID=UPI00255D1594|nr:PadR family transcriptional regulator [Propionimicrobium sp. PCR01-08-3]WIY82343.1 PadR family transcriptional regulator [Propionimicrobium sp. PCR01-08-3]
MALRQPTLDLAILGRLSHGPSYGYEVRKHVNMVVGYLHKVSFGSLYPALRRLLERGLICDCGTERPLLVGGRSRRIYHLTPAGEEYLTQQLATTDPSVWSDDFGVRFSLLGMTSPRNRLRILHGRREGSTSRLAAIDSWSLSGLDHYGQELVRHTRDVLAGELSWLDQMIAAEETGIQKDGIQEGE